MVRSCTARCIFNKHGCYGIRNYWFTFLIEVNDFEFIVNRKTGWIIGVPDPKKVKWSQISQKGILKS